MIDWINKNIGTDVATYISVFIGVIGLIYAGKKISKNRVQHQKCGDNSINIQGGRDIKIDSVKKK